MLYKVTGAGHSVCCVCVCVCARGGAWGKREEGEEGEGEERRERVELPDSLMDEAVLQSAGLGLESPQSPP